MHRSVSTDRCDDRGFTLVEILIVIVILGILATVTVFAVRGIGADGETVACEEDRMIVNTAAQSYFAQFHDVDADGVVSAHAGSACS